MAHGLKTTQLSVLLNVAAFLALAACSSSTSLSPGFSAAEADRTLYVSEHYTGYEARHIGEVVRTFERYGYQPTSDRSKSNFQLDFFIEGGATVTVRVALLQGRTKLLEVTSKNPGWGTVIARPTAIAGRVSDALEQLDQLLAESHASQ